MNDDTLIETNETVAPEQKSTQEVQEIMENETESKKPTKKVSAGVAAGIGVGAAAVGAAVAAVPFFAFAGDKEEHVIELQENEGGQEQHSNVDEHVPEVSDLSVATCVTDDMTPSEAFAAARAEVGPGGIYYYHGHAQGTYYENEWNSMSAEDKEDYWASVSHTHAEYVQEHPEVVANHHQTPQQEEIATQYTLDDIEDVNISLTLQVDANHNDKPDLVVDVDGDGVGDVVLLDVEMDEDGQVLSVADVRGGKYDLELDDEEEDENLNLENNDSLTSDDISEDEMDSSSEEVAYSPDYDYSANTDLDPNAFIDNSVDTLDMV